MDETFRKIAIIIIMGLIPIENSHSKDVYDLPPTVALQNRAYYLNHGLTAHLGYLPTDAFNKGIILGSSYTYFFNDFLAWEVANFNYAINQETALLEDLNSLNVTVSEADQELLDYFNWYATTSLVYTPLYNKSLLFNKSIVHGETSFVLGAGVGKFNVAKLRPLINVGIILRYFIEERMSLKFDIREQVFFTERSGAQGLLSIAVGFSYQLGGRKEKDTLK